MQAHQHERVDGFGQQQHFEALRLEGIQVRAAQDGLRVFTDDVVDEFLAFLHPPGVVFERGPGFGLEVGLEAQQRQHLVVFGWAGCHALFQVAAKLLPECGIFFGVVLCQGFQFLDDLPGQHFLQARHQPARLHRLARDVERQVFRIDHALREAQVFGQQVFVVFVNQDIARIQFQPVVLAQREHSAFALAGDVEQGIQLHRRVGHEMGGQQRLLEFQRQLAVEIGVLRFADIRFGRAPERGLFVDRFFVRADVDGETDVIGMFVDDVLDPVLLGKFGGVFFEDDFDFGAALGLFCRFDLVTVVAGGVPADCFGVPFKRAGGHLYRFGHHEHRVESHAKLADHARGVETLLFGGF